MAIRTNTNPRAMDLQPEMRDILMRNGMQAHIVSNAGQHQLVVQGHDSPLLTYNITQKQMLALSDWGTNSANKKAYNVFTSIVGNDFYLPKNFVHARNANGRVVMGLHGYRIGCDEYGRVGRLGMPPPFLGWTPRQQGGFHLRRVGGQLFYPQAPYVAERPDGRMKPGELQSGGYGFYYKGSQQQPAQEKDVLKELQTVITPMINRPRNQEPPKPYNELITSPVYFSNEKWQECLSSHGIIIDEKAKTLTIQSSATHADLVYDLKDSEIETLTSNSIKDVPIDKRLELINDIIKNDYADKLSIDMLNSKDVIAINLHPEVEQDLQERIQTEQEVIYPLANEQAKLIHDIKADAMVDGNDLAYLNENKGWFREDKNGREVEVSQIYVHPSETEGKYKMTAVINGESISHEISQKQYDKFMAVDDYHRMKLFSKVFNEVDMKTRPEASKGIGGQILAALTAGVAVTAGVVHGVNHHHHAPEFYAERFEGPRPYFKPGVDTPREIAARNFEAQANQIATDIRRGY